MIHDRIHAFRLDEYFISSHRDAELVGNVIGIVLVCLKVLFIDDRVEREFVQNEVLFTIIPVLGQLDYEFLIIHKPAELRADEVLCLAALQ
ncbi:hypothetical protein D3C74_46440 [compost metagenome]